MNPAEFLASQDFANVAKSCSPVTLQAGLIEKDRVFFDGRDELMAYWKNIIALENGDSL